MTWAITVTFWLVGLSRLIQRLTSEFIVTNMRLVMKTGLIQRDVLELLLSKIEGVAVKQSITGRVWNFGQVSITGSGGAKTTYKNIRGPLAFRKAIQEQAVQTPVAK